MALISLFKKKLISSASKGPGSDIHTDPNASVGDRRFVLKKEQGKIQLFTESYTGTAKYHNGSEYYQWWRNLLHQFNDEEELAEFRDGVTGFLDSETNEIILE